MKILNKRKLQDFTISKGELYQGGGTMLTPAPVDIPKTPMANLQMNVTPFVPTMPTVDKSDIKKRLSPSDEVLKQITGKGLTNDVNAVFSKLREADSMLNNVNDLDILAKTDTFSKIANVYNSVLSPEMINKLLNHKKSNEDAVEIMKSKKTHDSFVTLGNRILVEERDKDGQPDYKWVGVNSFDPNKQIPLTAANAESIRKNHPKFIFDESINEGLMQTVSKEDIKNQVDDSLGKLGQVKRGTLQKQLAVVSKEIGGFKGNLLANLTGGYTSTQNAKQIEHAVKGVLNSLTDDARTQLITSFMRQGKTAAQAYEASINFIADYASKATVDEYEDRKEEDIDQKQLRPGGAGSESLKELNYNVMTNATLLDGSQQNIDINGAIVNTMVYDGGFNTNLNDGRTPESGKDGKPALKPVNESRYSTLTKGTEKSLFVNGVATAIPRDMALMSGSDKVYVTYVKTGRNGEPIVLDPNNQDYKKLQSQISAKKEDLKKQGLPEDVIIEETERFENKLFGNNYKKVVMTSAYVPESALPKELEGKVQEANIPSSEITRALTNTGGKWSNLWQNETVYKVTVFNDATDVRTLRNLYAKSPYFDVQNSEPSADTPVKKQTQSAPSSLDQYPNK